MPDTLPLGHPVVVEALTNAPTAVRDAATRLDEAGHEIRLIWRDPVPEHTHGTGPLPGQIEVDAIHQEAVLASEVPNWTRVGHLFSTDRTHHLPTTRTAPDGTTAPVDLSLRIWRWGRRDTPHTTPRGTKPGKPCPQETAGKACKDCGTGQYWLLPEYIIPAWEPGLSDPNNKTRLHPDIAMLLALGAKPLKVVLADHARYARGFIGSPEPVRVARLMSFVFDDAKDTLFAKNKSGGTMVLRPDEVILKEHSPRFADEAPA